MRFTNLVLLVQENKTSEKFYKKLGFTIDVSTDTYSDIHLDNFKITLVNMRDEPEFAKDSIAEPKGKGMYIYIHVNDVNAEHKSPRTKGLKPATEPRDWPWGNREFILRDPDGYKLCFWHELPHQGTL